MSNPDFKNKINLKLVPRAILVVFCFISIFLFSSNTALATLSSPDGMMDISPNPLTFSTAPVSSIIKYVNITNQTSATISVWLIAGGGQCQPSTGNNPRNISVGAPILWDLLFICTGTPGTYIGYVFFYTNSFQEIAVLNYTVNVTAATPSTFTVSGTAGTNGSISPASKTVNSGSTTTFTVTPNAGYTASVGGTCGGSPSSGATAFTYTTNAISANCTVTVNFTVSALTITQSEWKIYKKPDLTTPFIAPVTLTGVNAMNNYTTLTTLPAGNYQAKLTVTNSNSLSATATKDFSVVTVSLPDLTASSPTQSTATVGTAITFTSTISNVGNASTGASFNNFFQVATATGGGGTITNLISSSMSALVAGTNNTATSPSYTFTSAATYSVRACADKSSSVNLGTIVESNETNNCGVWTNVTVTNAVATCGSITGPQTTTATTGFLNFYANNVVGAVSVNFKIKSLTAGNTFSYAGISDGTGRWTGSVNLANFVPVPDNLTTTVEMWSGAGNTGIMTLCGTHNWSRVPSIFGVTVRKTPGGHVRSSSVGINTASQTACTATGGSWSSLSCSYNFIGGTSVVLTATPDLNYRFVSWQGDCSGTLNTCTFNNISSPKTVTPIFILITLDYKEF